MKTFYSKTVKGLRFACAAIMVMAANSVFADDTTWDFTSLSATDSTNLAADTENWASTGSGNSFYFYNASTFGTYKNGADSSQCINYFQALTANDTELEETKGLYFGSYYQSGGKWCFGKNTSGRLRIYNNGIRLYGGGVAIAIDNLSEGDTVTFVTNSSSNYLNIGYNMTATAGFAANNATNTAIVDADGPVFVYASAQLFVYSITVKSKVATGISQPNTAVTSETDNVIYNLQGQRMPSNDVNALPSGIYIVNGKKVIK